MASSYRIATIMGIPIRVHVTFLLILPVFAVVFAINPSLFGDIQPAWLSYALGGVLAVVFFFCVLLHELGHSYVALRNDIQIKSITLIIFGGVSQMEEVPRDSRVEMLMALAGPAISLVIGVTLIAVYLLLGFSTVPLPGESVPVSGRVIGWLGLINVLLAAFNLIPAFPMDGGRVLRSLLSRRLPYLDATSRAASLGKAFAFMLGLFGFLTLPGGLWLILIAFFIYLGAGQEEVGTRVSFTLEGVDVARIMTREVTTVGPETELDEVVELMLERKHTGYPVLSNGRLVGIITLDDVHSVPRERRNRTTVEGAMSTELVTATPDTPAFDALKVMSRRGFGRLPVVENGELVGIISRTDLTRALEILGE
ncbi:MAG: Zinc metalloprotease [Methanonatronarchaeales archaeon]|nr:Zinc metalloprotease [Methanonatronarchaeales archaeon]